MANRNIQSKMRRSYLRHRPNRIARDDMRHLMNEAQNRAKYESDFGLGKFGLCSGDVMSPVMNQARIEQEDRQKGLYKLPLNVKLQDHVLLNPDAKSVCLFLFWTSSKALTREYYLIEINVDSGVKKRSKPYQERSHAMYDFLNSQITWIETVYPG
jgi:hypothetical protein